MQLEPAHSFVACWHSILNRRINGKQWTAAFAPGWQLQRYPLLLLATWTTKNGCT
jgi:hypothetical protein